MNHLNQLLQITLQFHDYKFALYSFFTAFVVTLFIIPVLIRIVNKYKLYDKPNERKEHRSPVPTLGGVAVMAGFISSIFLWLSFNTTPEQICFFFSLAILFGMGIMDDLKDLPARNKFMIQLALATLIALSGTRITSFNGLLGLETLPLFSQYLFTILIIVGVTNSFNLIDGIDGLAGGIGFMSLVTLGIFISLNGDFASALIAFALAGGLLAFLYFNFNPAKIFMGDTGSLVLGFVISFLCIKLLQANTNAAFPVLPHAVVFIFGIVLIPIFDTLRVFAYRILRGKSPFSADRTHIHHLLTNNGFSHGFAARIICIIHGIILIEIYLLRDLRQEWIILLSILFMITATCILYKSQLIFGKFVATSKKRSVVQARKQ